MPLMKFSQGCVLLQRFAQERTYVYGHSRASDPHGLLDWRLQFSASGVGWCLPLFPNPWLFPPDCLLTWQLASSTVSVSMGKGNPRQSYRLFLAVLDLHCSLQTKLLCSMWELSSPTRDQTHISCTGRWIHSHWIAEEVPAVFFKSVSEVTSQCFCFILFFRSKSLNLAHKQGD